MPAIVRNISLTQYTIADLQQNLGASKGLAILWVRSFGSDHFIVRVLPKLNQRESNASTHFLTSLNNVPNSNFSIPRNFSQTCLLEAKSHLKQYTQSIQQSLSTRERKSHRGKPILWTISTSSTHSSILQIPIESIQKVNMYFLVD